MIDVPFEVRQNGTYVMVVKWEDPLASEWVSEWVDVLPLTLHRRVRKQKETGNLLRMTREDSEAMAKQHREVEKEPMGEAGGRHDARHATPRTSRLYPPGPLNPRCLRQMGSFACLRSGGQLLEAQRHHLDG